MEKKGENSSRNIYDKLILLFSIILLLDLIIFMFVFFPKLIESEQKSGCGDNTSELECSINKPYFCENITLVPKSSICGCPENFKSSGEQCINKYYTGPEKRYFEYILNGETGIIEINVYSGIAKYVSSIPRVMYYTDKLPSKKDFVLKDIEDRIQRQALMPLVIEIENTAKDKDTQAKIAISLVQKIPYGELDKKILFKNINIQGYRLPYEVIYDKKGVCEEKSELLIFMLKELGFGTALFYYPQENHAAVGIKCPVEKSFRNSGYCFIETTTPSIISKYQNNFIGSKKLHSNPMIIPITDGISLSENLDDYDDSEKWIYLNTLLEKDGYLNYFREKQREKLIKKYGLQVS